MPMNTRAFSSDQHEGRLLDELLYLAQKFRSNCPINHPVVTGKPQIQTQAGDNLVAINVMHTNFSAMDIDRPEGMAVDMAWT